MELNETKDTEGGTTKENTMIAYREERVRATTASYVRDVATSGTAGAVGGMPTSLASPHSVIAIGEEEELAVPGPPSGCSPRTAGRTISSASPAL